MSHDADPPRERPDEPGGPASSAPSPEPMGEPPREIVLPRGCNPLTFGVVMATLEMALFLVLWQRCR